MEGLKNTQYNFKTIKQALIVKKLAIMPFHNHLMKLLIKKIAMLIKMDFTQFKALHIK